MFLLLKYQKLWTFLVKNSKKKVDMFFSVLLYGITHQPKIIGTIILQGGAEMAGGMMVNRQQAGRHPVTPVVNVDIEQVQHGHQVATSRTTRAMSRIAWGH